MGGLALRLFWRSTVLAHPVPPSSPLLLPLHSRSPFHLSNHRNDKPCLVSHRTGFLLSFLPPAACLVSHRAACLLFLPLCPLLPVLPLLPACHPFHMSHPLPQLLLTLVCVTPGCITNSFYSCHFGSALRSLPGTIFQSISVHKYKSWKPIQMVPQL